MHTVFALLCFVVVIHWLIFPYPSGFLHWHCGNLTLVPVPAKQPWWIWINTSCEFIMNDCITTTKQSTTKPCAYFLGYTVMNKAFAALGLPRWLLSYVTFPSESKREYNFMNVLPTAQDSHFDFSLRWRYYGIQMDYPKNMHIVESHQPVLSCEHQFKIIFPVAILWVRIAKSIVHDTDVAGVGLMSTRYWPFVGVWLYNSHGVANIPVATRRHLRPLLNWSVTETSGH